MLNESEMSMAKELASELVVVQEKKTKRNITHSLNEIKKAIMDLFKEMKNTAVEVWEAIKYTEVMKCERDIHDYNWLIPLDTSLASQVKLSNIHMPKIRSSI